MRTAATCTPPEKKDLGALLLKAVGGLALGGLPGLVAGLAWSAIEGNPPPPIGDWGLDARGTLNVDRPEPDVTAGPASAGKVVHPKGLALTEPGAELVEWRADEYVQIAARRYGCLVERGARVWWPSLDGRRGYCGSWGPCLADDPVGRRAGMRFPEFWRMFFLALAKKGV